MVAVTPINGLRMAELTDLPNMQTAMSNIGSDLDTRLVPRFANSGARDAAITAPVEGMYCDVAGIGLMRYNGVSWDAIGSVTKVRKTADEQVTSSTTFQADDDLTLPISANATYRLEMFLAVFGPSAGDFKWRLALPTGCTTDIFELGPADSVVTVMDTNAKMSTRTGDTGTQVPGGQSGGEVAVGTDGNFNSFIHVFAFIQVGGTAGNAALEWAQNASSGSATTVRAGSWMIMHDIT